MSGELDRRAFLSRSAAASVGAAVAFNFEERALLAHAGAAQVPVQTGVAVKPFPTGKIKNLTLTRLMGGGNLTSGFAHSRDLLYVSALLRHYFTDEKVYETWRLSEENGLNAMILRVDDHVIRLLKTYRKEYGGKFQWLAQCRLTEADITGDIKRAVDNGAVAAYVHGGVADSLVEKNRLDVLEKGLEAIQKEGLPAGIAGHAVSVPIACEDAGLPVDFYMKTINSKSYWSAGPMPRFDSVWEETPEITIEFMSRVSKPWIGYKVLGAGALRPREGFKFAFENGCDFICVGMFDFQVAEDVRIAREVLEGGMNRKRAWV